MKTKRVSVILPTYNEKENIKELIRQIYHYCRKDLYEVIVVDDNSPDETWKIAEMLQKKYRSLRIIRRINEKGLPSAIWAGITHAKGNVVVWLDCDLSHPPKIIPKMIRQIPEYDVVIASRYVENGKDKRPFTRVLASKLINAFSKLVLGLKIKDMTSGFYSVKKEVFSKIRLMKTGYAEYCIRLSYESSKKGFKIKEIGYAFSERKKGTSKTFSNISGFLYNGYLCIREILRLRIKGA